jgi:hypothetical protein
MAEQVPEPADYRATEAPRVPSPDLVPAPTAAPAPASEDLIDLRFLFAAIWRGKWLLILLAFLGSLYGLRDMRNFVPQFEATMVVAPSRGGGVAPSGGGRSSRLKGVAKSFGLDLGGDEATTFDRLELVLSSLTLARLLQNEHGYLQKVYEGSWEPEGERWVRPTGRRFEWEQRLKGLFHLGTWSEPTVESLARYLKGSIVITKLELEPFRRISFAHTDPGFAYELLTTVYREADELLRQQDRAATAERRAYVQQQLQSAKMLETRDVLIGMLTNEEHTAMMLQSTLPYAARIIEPAFVSSTPTSPTVVGSLGPPVAIVVALGITLILLVALFRRDA